MSSRLRSWACLRAWARSLEVLSSSIGTRRPRSARRSMIALRRDEARRKNQAPHRLSSARRQIDAFCPKKPQRGSIEFVYVLRVRSAASLAAMHVAVAPDPAVTMAVVVHLRKAAIVLGDAGRQWRNRRSL